MQSTTATNAGVDGAFAPSTSVIRPQLAGRRIVALGGGTGLSTLLRGLKPLCFGEDTVPGAPLSDEARARLTAIVTVADDGGSSGRLRQAYPVLAPGDIRSCLLALAGSDPSLQAMFGFRFNGAVNDHSLGNLIITALAQLECDFPRAVELAATLLNVRGRVLPATGDEVRLLAECEDGSCIRGESRITRAGRRISRVHLDPRNCRMLPQAGSAIADADAVIIGPGSLYTSLLPTLLVPGVAEAIAASGARVILVMNLMTEPGETDGYGPEDFLAALAVHVPQLPIHELLVNDAPIPALQRQHYAGKGALPIRWNEACRNRPGCRVVLRDLVEAGDKVRHDSGKLARAILERVGSPLPSEPQVGTGSGVNDFNARVGAAGGEA